MTDLSSPPVVSSSLMSISQSISILQASSISASFGYNGTPSLYSTILTIFYMSRSNLAIILSLCNLTSQAAMCAENTSASTLYFLFAQRVKSPYQDLSIAMNIFSLPSVSKSIISCLIILFSKLLIGGSISSNSTSLNSTRLASTCLYFIIALRRHYFCLLSISYLMWGIKRSSIPYIQLRILWAEI